MAAALVATTFWFGNVTQNDDQWVRHTLEVRNKISQVANLLRDLERGERGFLLTSHDIDLVPLRARHCPRCLTH
jgi:CHASE3 domain sensor protein